MSKKHSFHIPVMGIGFTIDTPLKVSQYGMDSVISIVDDILLEKLRKMYCEKFEMPYQAITEKIEDFRAKRITSYLNLINNLAEKKFDEVKNATISKHNELKEYFNLLPDSSSIKKEFNKLVAKKFNINEIKNWVKDNLTMGSIDVNIMTKLDKENFKNGEKLPSEFNDAHAALRGYATSDLNSSLILSAGMNPRLYSYLENFNDFFPNKNGEFKKKIVLKVSDFRSALIQGKFLAKKGLWVSEYRIESGLNCGGHAFATEGFLMGPILEEFKLNRNDLIQSVHDILIPALKNKQRVIPSKILDLKVTTQGGVGTGEEHQFLIDEYELDSVGWGSPFLLVPEATTVDETTMNKLMGAKEKDLYLSNISPLGVPFNSLKGNSKDIEKLEIANSGRPGSTCPKEYLSSNKEFTDKNICTASRQYQRNKIKELETQDISKENFNKKFDAIIDKSCLCVGLASSALLKNKIESKYKKGVSVCPGPNMAYFSKLMSLKEITDHIYNRTNVIIRDDRPNMFVKELKLYLEYLKNKIEETSVSINKKQEKYLIGFSHNLSEGINYYQNLFLNIKDKFEDTKSNILKELELSKETLKKLQVEIETLTNKMVFSQ
jgi:hypothetical protein